MTQLINPATEEVLRSVEHADVAAVDDAVLRAQVAQRRWASLAPAERAAWLGRPTGRPATSATC
jgi:acyl-CoA reductase-like NAD-dependent aldehyde dehydrogenase